MKIPKPNPKVYRLAAMLVDNGQQGYSCCAITLASMRLDLTDAERRMHHLAYLCMFGPLTFRRKGPMVYVPSGGQSIEHSGKWSSRMENEHPFWNVGSWETRKGVTPESAKADRVMALLMMAAIVENPA